MPTLDGFVSGVLVALTAQSVVQLYVVPRVEQHKRREQRFEQNVDALAALLAGDLTRTAGAAGTSARLNAAVVDSVTEEEPSMRSRLLSTWVKEARDHQSAYEAVARGPVELLLNRIVAFAPDAPDLQRLDELAQRYRHASLAAMLHAYLTDPDEPADPQVVEADWNNERSTRSALMGAVAALSARRRPPRATLGRRARLAAKRSRLRAPWKDV